MKNGVSWLAMWAIVATVVAPASAQQQQAVPSNGARAVLEQAAQEGKYVFLMFYKQVDTASSAMAATLKEGLTDRSQAAVLAHVRVGDPVDQALVDKYNLARAPLPVTLAIAPNGALTAIFAQKVTLDKVDEAFVTPTMMVTMKSLQEGKLVLVTVRGSAKAAAPVAVKDFQDDPHFKDRIVAASLFAADPREAKFVAQMQIDPVTPATQTVLLAPPGAMVGKFSAGATKDQIAAALAKAGKCCDDPNCKHHQPAPAPRATAPSPNTRRN